jgi:hypothetical protein
MPNEYTSAYAPMQSNAQYGQPVTMGQGQQEAMHQAMLQQQQQYNNQSANIAGQPNGLSRMTAPMQQMMLAQALRGYSPTSGSVELPKIDPQMSGVAGMGDSMGTGVTYGGTNFGQINPMSNGGFGLK